jgi:hypothetical protein
MFNEELTPLTHTPHQQLPMANGKNSQHPINNTQCSMRRSHPCSNKLATCNPQLPISCNTYQLNPTIILIYYPFLIKSTIFGAQNFT